MTTNFRRTFGDAASPLPLSYLDENFNQLENTSTSTVTLAGAGLVGYIASGSGAISTNVQDYLRLNRIVHGWIPTALWAGIAARTNTTDLATYIQAAMDAVGTHGGDLYFPEGDYLVASGLAPTKRLMMRGAGTSESAAQTGPTRIIKKSTMTSAALVLSVASSSVEGIEFEGENGNTGDGIQVSAGRVQLKDVAVYSMGRDGIRIGTDAGVNANVWFLQNIKAKSNGRHGVYISDGGPDCNAGTFVGGDLQSNTSDGLRLGATRFNTFISITPQTNGGDGVHLTGNAVDNSFFGGDFNESNTDNDLEIESGATRNAFFWPILTAAQTSDAGTNTVLFSQQATLPQALSWTGLTSSAAELNILDGVNATTEEVNSLDVSQRVKLLDDFLGDVLADQWNGRVGTDPQCVTPTILANQNRGLVRLTAGDDAAATMAANGVQLESSLNWRAVQGSLAIECRFTLNSVANIAFFVGFTDQASALEMPINSASSNDDITYNADNAVGVMFDTAMATDNWWLVGVASTTPATAQNAAVAPTGGGVETWRVELSTGGVATFYRNGVAIGSAMTGSVTASTQLTPVVAAFSRTTATKTVDVDYIYVQSAR